MELLVPNPSGGRGIYILHWAAVRERYRPTVHDTVLLQRLADPVWLDPRTVRAVAWEIAREGLAGQEARAAATVAGNADRSQRQQAEFLLLNALVKQVEPHGTALTSLVDNPVELARRGSEILHRLAPAFSVTGRELGDQVAKLGNIFAPVGIMPDDRNARVPRLIQRLRQTQDDMVRVFDAEDANDGARTRSTPFSGAPSSGGPSGGAANGGVSLGQSVIASMQAAEACAGIVLTATRALLADPLTLLKHWVANPAQVTTLVTRTDWILDGWEHIALLWLSARNNAERRSVLLEMALLVPILPREAMNWTQAPLPQDALDPIRVTSQNDAWRTGGLAFVQIGRNEKLRAMSL